MPQTLLLLLLLLLPGCLEWKWRREEEEEEETPAETHTASCPKDRQQMKRKSVPIWLAGCYCALVTMKQGTCRLGRREEEEEVVVVRIPLWPSCSPRNGNGNGKFARTWERNTGNASTDREVLAYLAGTPGSGG